jgi:hypothetical protein
MVFLEASLLCEPAARSVRSEKNSTPDSHELQTD